MSRFPAARLFYIQTRVANLPAAVQRKMSRGDRGRTESRLKSLSLNVRCISTETDYKCNYDYQFEVKCPKYFAFVRYIHWHLPLPPQNKNKPETTTTKINKPTTTTKKTKIPKPPVMITHHTPSKKMKIKNSTSRGQQDPGNVQMGPKGGRASDDVFLKRS